MPHNALDRLRAIVARYFVIGLWLHVPVLVAVGVALEVGAASRRASAIHVPQLRPVVAPVAYSAPTQIAV